MNKFRQPVTKAGQNSKNCASQKMKALFHYVCYVQMFKVLNCSDEGKGLTFCEKPS